MKNPELQPTLQAIASTAVSMLSPARHAGLTVFSRGELIPRASTGEPPAAGPPPARTRGWPCINAAKHQSVFRIEDIRQDERWPKFSEEAARLDVRSMLCVPLWGDERGLGALRLYGGEAAAFTDLHERVTTLLAMFAALALAEAQRADQMHDALGNRDVIGQAKGILMERHGVSADAAFGVLSRVSQAENMKLADIARRLVETGQRVGLGLVNRPLALHESSARGEREQEEVHRAVLAIDAPGAVPVPRLAGTLGRGAGLGAWELAGGSGQEIALAITPAGQRLAAWIRDQRRADLARGLESMSPEDRLALLRGLGELALRLADRPPRPRDGVVS